MDQVWFFLIMAGISWAAFHGRADISGVFLTEAREAVLFIVSLAGGIAFWSGLMKIAEESGLAVFLGKIAEKPLSFLLPGIKTYPRALQAITLSLCANFLGIGNAATPLGIKAMQELQNANPDRNTASDAMCTYMALVMSGLTILPGTVLILRTETGSGFPGAVIFPTLLATMAGTAAALFLDKFFRSCGNRKKHRRLEAVPWKKPGRAVGL